jgi:hypothetical protein
MSSASKPTRRTSPRKASKQQPTSMTSEIPFDAHQSTTLPAVNTAGNGMVELKDKAGGKTSTSCGGSTMGKCHYKKCGIVTMEDLESCAALGCKKKRFIRPVWKLCMNDALGSTQPKWQILVLFVPKLVITSVAAASRKPNWGNDGAKGPNDPKSSEWILLDWLLAEGNYANKWRGKDSRGKKKKHVAAEIAALINAGKVKVVRDGKQVMNKISHIEKSFRLAHDFANTETGQGLQENNWGEFDDAVRRKCPYYFDLLEIFGDRASAKPKATSNDNLDSSEEEDGASKDLDLFSVGSEYDDDSGGDIHMDMSKYNDDDGDDDDGDDDDDDYVEEGEGEEVVDASTKKKQGKSSKQDENTSGQKRKNAALSSATLIGAASTKKNKSTVTLFDQGTSDNLATLAASHKKVADARLKQIMHDNQSKMAVDAAAAEQADLELRMKKFQTLMDIRQKHPTLTNEQIVQMFPMLADFVNIVK